MRVLSVIAIMWLWCQPLQAFAPARPQSKRARALYGGATTLDPPTRERTDRKTGDDTGYANDREDGVDYPDLEYLQDPAESREAEDPFHILLLGETFDKPKISISYVAGSLEYVLGMPHGEATEQSRFAKQEGFACLGTWPRQECLSLGRQLQMRDIVCRVVPFAEGGQRGWQAKDAADSTSSSSVARSGDFFR